MDRLAWMGRIRPGMKEEYLKRHGAIWPQMLALLKSAGIRNYTIFCGGSDGLDLVGYFECERGVPYAETKGLVTWQGYRYTDGLFLQRFLP